MKRDDAEQLARDYCARNVDRIERMGLGAVTRAAAERFVLKEARHHYGTNLTGAAEARIKRYLRASRTSAPS